MSTKTKLQPKSQPKNAVEHVRRSSSSSSYRVPVDSDRDPVDSRAHSVAQILELASPELEMIRPRVQFPQSRRYSRHDRFTRRKRLITTVRSLHSVAFRQGQISKDAR